MITEGLAFLITQLQPLVLVPSSGLLEEDFNTILSKDLGLRTETEFEIFEQEDNETFVISVDGVPITTELSTEAVTYLLMIQGGSNNPVNGVAIDDTTMALELANNPFLTNDYPVLVGTTEATVNSTGTNASVLVLNESILTVGEPYKVVDRLGSLLSKTPLPEPKINEFLNSKTKFFIRI